MKRAAVRFTHRVRTAAGVLASAALGLGAGAGRADVIDLTWQDGGRFERSLALAPGKFAEICGALQPGQAVEWSFKANHAVNFNIHYHVGEDVRYPAKHNQVRNRRGTLAVRSAQDYCWMWVNKATATATLTVTLTRVASAR